MLTHSPVTTILPVKDLDRARNFYQRTLGLDGVGLQSDGKYLLRCNGGSLLALFPKPGGTKAEHTAVSFKVNDIVAEIRELESRGVRFHDYDLPGFKTVGHVAVLGAEKAAWFDDTEGNILCVHEDLERVQAEAGEAAAARPGRVC
jgi:catechol 2,3-dioxygenase-like lactoylglutathione lyase family enzyme